MATDNLLQHLRDLEIALHQPDVRRDPARLDELLRESFRLPNSAVRGVATAGLILWNSYPLKSHWDRSGPKTSQWRRSLKISCYSPINQRTSTQMVNLVAIPLDRRYGSGRRADGRCGFTKVQNDPLPHYSPTAARSRVIRRVNNGISCGDVGSLPLLVVSYTERPV